MVLDLFLLFCVSLCSFCVICSHCVNLFGSSAVFFMPISNKISDSAKLYMMIANIDIVFKDMFRHRLHLGKVMGQG